MAALPEATTATAVDADEADVKNFLTGMRDFLSGLFGATGTAADARAALGVTPLTSGSIATTLGYTPTSPAALAAYVGAYAASNTAIVSIAMFDNGPGAYWGIRCTRANGAVFDVNLRFNTDPGGGE